QVFFVISGFIIPLSMHRAGYRIRSFFRFLLKRIVRLDPPYLASVAIVVLAYWLGSRVPGHEGPPYRIPWRLVLAHIRYLPAFLNQPWLQAPYWSLAVEFQYYLFAGLLFPLLALEGRIASASVLLLFAALSEFAGWRESWLPHHLPLFLLGIAAFRFKCLNAGRVELAAGALFAFGLTVRTNGWPAAYAGALTFLIILLINRGARILGFFGKI